MIRFIDYYQMLGIPTDAKPRAIEKAYRKKVLFLDSHGGESSDNNEVIELFRNTNEAHLVLLNHEARQVFDKLRAIYRHNDLIPGASTTQVQPKASTIAGVLSNYLHSEFYTTYFQHFSERPVQPKAKAPLQLKLPTQLALPPLPQLSVLTTRKGMLSATTIALLIIAAMLLTPSPQSIRDIIHTYGKATPFEKVHLAELVSKHPEATAAKEMLLTALTNQQEEIIVRSAAAKSLAVFAGQDLDVQNALIEAVNSPQAFLRIHATTALGLIKAPSAAITQTLFLGLSDDNEQVRLASSIAIANFGAALVEKNITTASNEGTAVEHEDEVANLDKLASQKQDSTDKLSIATALEDLKDPEPSVRVAAIHALESNSELPEAAIEEIIAMLNDTDSEVVAAAAETIGFLQSEKAIWPLLSLLADQDQTVRLAVADALNRMPREKVELALSQVPKDQLAQLDETQPPAPAVAPPSPPVEVAAVKVEPIKAPLTVITPTVVAMAPPKSVNPELALGKKARQLPPPLRYRNEQIELYPDIARLRSTAIAIASSEQAAEVQPMLASLPLRQESLIQSKTETPQLIDNTPSGAGALHLAKLSTRYETVPNPFPATPALYQDDRAKTPITQLAKLSLRSEEIPNPKSATPHLAQDNTRQKLALHLAKLALLSETIPNPQSATPELTQTAIRKVTTTQLAKLSLRSEPIPEVVPPTAETQTAALLQPTTPSDTAQIPATVSAALGIDSIDNIPWQQAVKLTKAKLGTTNREVALTELLQHPNQKLQTLACFAIAQRATASQTELLAIKQLLNSNTPQIQAAAAWALAEIPNSANPEAERRLGELVKSKNFWVNMHAARALGRFGTATAQELLKQQNG
jgi:HEAT repeat protein